MFLIRFLQSLVMPSKMAKYGKMNIIIAIAIFILSSGLLALPNSMYISNHRYELVDNQDSYHLQIFTKLSAAQMDVFQSSTCTVENQMMAASSPEVIQQGEPYIFDVVYQDKDAKLYVVFDLYDIHDPDASPSYNIQERFIPLEGDNNYLIVFYEDGVYYHTPDFYKELNYAKGYDFTFASLTTGAELAYHLIDMYMGDIRMEISFNTFLICVAYTLIFIIVMWMVYKTTQTPMTFKEMYNIGAMASIVPLIIIVVLSLIFPRTTFIFYYITLFGLMDVFVLYRINKLKKLV